MHFFLKITLCLFIYFIPFSLFAQEIKVEIDSTSLVTKGLFTITISATNTPIKTYGDFPDIEGFTQQEIIRETTAEKDTSSQDIESIEKIIQCYQAQKNGVFYLDDFTIEVNDKEIRVLGREIQVLLLEKDPETPDQEEIRPSDFNEQPQTFFLGLSGSEKEIYLGEGVNITLALYLAENNRTNLQPHRLEEQIQKIIKNLKPIHCWEENFGIQKLSPVTVFIHQKKFFQYKLYQATFYPQKALDIHFPSVALSMKNKSKNHTKDSLEILYSNELKIQVKQLPRYPVPKKIPVGVYQLNEAISKINLSTKEGFYYDFIVQGKGNIALLPEPVIVASDRLLFRPIGFYSQIKRAFNLVSGQKKFSYYVQTKEAGQYDLSKYIRLVFFDPIAQKYDTLSSFKTVEVVGESLRNLEIGQVKHDEYDEIGNTFSINKHIHYQAINSIVSLLLFLLLFLFLLLLWKKWHYEK